MVTFLLAIGVLTVTGSVGVAALARARLGLTPLELVAYGVPLGGVMASLLLLGLGIVFGLTAPVVGLLALVCAATAFALWPGRARWLGHLATTATGRRWLLATGSSLGVIAQPGRVVAGAGQRSVGRLRWTRWTHHVPAGWLPTLVLIALGVRWVLYFRSALTVDGGALWAGHQFLWSDWSFHIGDVAGFAYGDNFPPENLLVAGKPYAYYFLASLTSAALVPLGLSAAQALSVVSGFYSLCIGLSLYAFARRLIGNHGAAVLAVVLALFGGSLGWLITAQQIDRTDDFWGVLLRGNPWDYPSLVDANLMGGIPYIFRLASERGYVFGLPLALLTLTLLLIGTERTTAHPFIAAGVVAGLLPLAHLPSLLALALITPFLFLLFPSRQWFLALPAAVLLAAPQLWWLLGGGGGASSLRIQVGWIAAPDPWWWFWLKNLGLFLPLVVLALLNRTALPARSRRALWAFMPIFVVANLVVFSPWAGDSTKLFFYWLIGASILIAALLAEAWRRTPTLVVRTLIVGAVATMTLNGFVGSLDQLRGMDRFQLLSAEEVRLARIIRESTPPQAVFVAGMQSNHPVSMLTGRPVVLGFPGFAWSHGTPAWDIEADVEAIYRFDPAAPELLTRYDVSYVVIGPIERRRLEVNEEAFQARYPVVIQTENIDVYAVTPEAEAAVDGTDDGR